MSREGHLFNLEGGNDLTTLGASWFVSYSYFKYCDSKHLNWKTVGTCSSRQSVYNRTQKYHEYWLNAILKMDERNLNKNRLNLQGVDIKRMAKEILSVI